MNNYIKNYIKPWAFNCHAKVNHEYDGLPYSVHLQMVADTASQFIHLIPEYEQENVLAAAYLHDTLEDVHFLTYNNLKERVNEKVADIVFAVTNEKGKTRKDRANDKYYEEMRQNESAVFVKICDRIANMLYSKNSGSGMYRKYKDEYANFKEQTYLPEFQEMYDYLETI